MSDKSNESIEQRVVDVFSKLFPNSNTHTIFVTSLILILIGRTKYYVLFVCEINIIVFYNFENQKNNYRLRKAVKFNVFSSFGFENFGFL